MLVQSAQAILHSFLGSQRASSRRMSTPQNPPRIYLHDVPILPCPEDDYFVHQFSPMTSMIPCPTTSHVPQQTSTTNRARTKTLRKMCGYFFDDIKTETKKVLCAQLGSRQTGEARLRGGPVGARSAEPVPETRSGNALEPVPPETSRLSRTITAMPRKETTAATRPPTT